MMVLSYAVLVAGALSISVSVMRLIDKLEHPRAKRKTPTKGELRRGRVNKCGAFTDAFSVSNM